VGKFCLKDGTPLEVVAHAPEDNTFQEPAPSRPPAGRDEALVGLLLADRFQVESLIGRGGMGIIYRARHLMLDRTVAVKFLHHYFVADERAAGRFVREARAMARIEHPNAATVYDFGVMPDGAAYIVMEYVEGESLRGALSRSGPFPILEALAIADQVCGAVEAAHRQGVIHRDLKPENILLKRTGEGLTVKVVDFGLAKIAGTSVTDSGQVVTAAGEFFGTPAYMAPEFYTGEEITEAADIYALGIILFEMLTGQPPFHGPVQAVITGHLFREAPALSALVPGLPPAVEAAVRLGLRKAASDRPASAAELAAWLRTAYPGAAGAAAATAHIAVPPALADDDSQPEPLSRPAAARPRYTRRRGRRTAALKRGELTAVLRDPPEPGPGEQTAPLEEGSGAPLPGRRKVMGLAAIGTGVLILGSVFAAFNTASTFDAPPTQPAAPAPETPQPAAPTPVAPVAVGATEPAPRTPPPPPAEPAAEPDPEPEPPAAHAGRTRRTREARPAAEAPKKVDRRTTGAKPPEPKKEKKRKWYDPRKWF
jgi:serine/threonine-protein kinase